MLPAISMRQGCRVFCEDLGKLISYQQNEVGQLQTDHAQSVGSRCVSSVLYCVLGVTVCLLTLVCNSCSIVYGHANQRT